MARCAGSECDASGKFDEGEGVGGNPVHSSWSIQRYLLRAFSPVLSSFSLPLEGLFFDKQLLVDFYSFIPLHSHHPPHSFTKITHAGTGFVCHCWAAGSADNDQSSLYSSGSYSHYISRW